MQNQPTVLISGASIAGPTLAYWLNHYGFKVAIVERAPALRPGGYAIDVRGAAVEVLKKMNLFQSAKALDTNMDTVEFVGDNKAQLLKIDADTFGGRYGDDLEIMRGDLAGLLYEATKDMAEYIWNDSITSIEETSQGTLVRFEKSPARTFNAVIGADGLHSQVRRLVFGEESQFLKHLGAYISIATIPNYANLDHQEKLYGTVGKTTAVYSARQNREAKVMFLFNSAPLTYDRHNPAEQKSILRTTFGSEAWEVPQLLNLVEESNDFYLDSVSQVHVPSYSKGHVALVGDAGYCPSPASGQGTSVAMVGAYILAREMGKTATNLPAAFAAYEACMRPFAAKNQKIAPVALKGMITPSKAYIRARNLMFHIPALFTFMNKQVMDMIQKAATSIKLDD